jgi:hypothetical protein
LSASPEQFFSSLITAGELAKQIAIAAKPVSTPGVKNRNFMRNSFAALVTVLFELTSLVHGHADNPERKMGRTTLRRFEEVRQLTFRHPQGLPHRDNRRRSGNAILDCRDFDVVAICGDAVNASAAFSHDERLSAGRSQAVGKLQRPRRFQLGDFAWEPVFDVNTKEITLGERVDVQVAIVAESDAVQPRGALGRLFESRISARLVEYRRLGPDLRASELVTWSEPSSPTMSQGSRLEFRTHLALWRKDRSLSGAADGAGARDTGRGKVIGTDPNKVSLLVDQNAKRRAGIERTRLDPLFYDLRLRLDAPHAADCGAAHIECAVRRSCDALGIRVVAGQFDFIQVTRKGCP